MVEESTLGVACRFCFRSGAQQCIAGIALIRDVMNGAGEANRLARVVTFGLGAFAHPDPGAVLVAHAVFEVVRHVELQMGGSEVADACRVVWMDQGADAVARIAQFAGLVAEHFVVTRRAPHRAGAQIRIEQSILCAGHGAFESLLRFAQQVFGELLLMDVPDRAGAANRFAVFVAFHRAAQLEPTEFAVSHLQADRHIVRCAILQVLEDGGALRRNIGGMRQVDQVVGIQCREIGRIVTGERRIAR